MKPETLLRLYPRAWRERYGEEFLALIQRVGLTPADVIDIARAALREWAVVLAPVGAKFIGLYGLLWITIFSLEWLLPLGRFQELRVFSGRDHVRILLAFSTSAAVARTLDAWALRNSPAPSKGRVQALGAASNLLCVMVNYAWSLSAPQWAIAGPLAIMAILSGNLFGRRREMLARLNALTPGWTPRPPSITRLGLSA